MKIVVIGGTGTIGRAIVEEMQPRHEIVAAGRSHGDRQVDITDPASVQALFDHIGRFDALIAATGNLHFGPVTETTAEQFNVGLQDKLLGQIRVALAGQHYLNDGGSITLTSGIVADACREAAQWSTGESM